MESVAVIIVSWNSSSLMEGVLDALSRQTLLPTRVIVIDNDSDDVDTLAEIVSGHHGCELIRLSNNCGFAAANNIGIARATDVDFVALLNPDAFPEPEWLAQLIIAARKHLNAASFSSRLLNHAMPSLLDGAGDCLSIWGKPWRRGHGYSADSRYIKEEPVFCASAAAALYRRRLLIETGGFDEDYFCYSEDVDLGFRLRLAGYDAVYVPTAVAHHIGSATTGGQHSDFSVYYGHRNLVWTFVKNVPGWLFWCLLPLHLLLNFITLIWFLKKGQGKIIVRAKIDAIRGLPQAWKKRKQIQAKRVTGIRDIWQVLDKRFTKYKKI